MSHNYPYRRPPSDTDLRSEAGPYRSAGRRHASPDHDFYRPPQESFSSSYPSSSSSRGLTSAQCSQDGALSILSSCGLEPSDLALLAELPEDVLTVESLPQVLAQIKGKRGTIRSFPTNSLSAPSSSSSYHRLAVSSSPSDRDHLSSRPIQYPIDQVTLSPLLSEHDCWGNPRTSLSVRAHPTPSSTSRYVVDFQHRPGPPEYGKIVRATGPVSSQELPSFSSAGQGKRTYPAQFSEPRSADYRTSPPDEYHPKPRGGHRESQTSSIRSSSREAAAVSMPSEKKALDFHGTCPTVFPYSCSLCDITVLSEKVWIKHINGTQHAEGQLTLLQQFSNWDCRLESLSRPNNQSENRKDEEKTSHSSQTHKPQPNIKPENKASEKSKVVCVRFPPQSVDETYLRKLTEPFGNIVKILMFPSLAFVELGSIDQAKDLVTFHINYPPTVNGEKIEFRISNTFNFFQSSRVVSFTPVPKGEDGKSDLISIVKRFGPVLYTLFLPSMAFLEMKNASDAQKLINHYCSNTLRIKNDFIKVGFSGEHKTLMGVPSAKRYEEETFSTKRSRSLSREKDNSRKRKRSSSKDQEGQNKKTSRERRSRDESNKQKKTRSRSREKIREKSSRETRSRSKSRPRERSSKESKNRRSRSREKSSREKRTNTKSVSSDKSSGRSSRQSSSRQKAVEETTPETKSRTKGEQTPLAEAAEKPQIDEKAALSAGESEIEGMEVIGEDGENVEEDADGKEEEVKENKSQAERTDTDKKVKDRNEEEEDLVCEMKVDDSETRRETKKATKTQLEDDKEPDSSVDLNNCITLDELEDHQSDRGGEHDKDDAKAPSIRVIYFKNLPMSSYTDVEFLRLVKDFGKAVRYLIIRKRKEGFIEMSSSSEAQKAAKVLRCKRITFKGYKVNARMSHKYYRLINGLDIPPNPDNEKRSQSQSSSRRKSERQSKSKTSDRDEISEVKEPSKRTPEKESGSKTSTEKKPDKDSAQNKTEEKDLKTSSKTESNGRKSPDKESGSKTSTEKKSDKDSAQNKTQEKDHKTSSKTESNGRKSPEKESGSKTSTEKKSDKDSAQNKTEEKDLKTSSKTESNGRKTPEKESGSKTSTEKKSDKDSAQNKTEEKDLKTSSKKESNSRKTPEKDSGSKTSTEKKSDKDSAQNKTEEKDHKTSSKKESNGRKSPEKESESKKSALKELSNLKPQEKPSQEESVTADKESLETNEEQMKIEKECDGRKSSDKESEKTSRSPDNESSEEEPSSGKTEEKNSVVLSSSTKGLEKQLLPGMSQDDKILKTPENDLVPDKTLKTDSDGESSQTEKENLETGEKHGPAEEGKQKSYEGQGVCSKEEPSESAVTNPDLVEQPIKQEAYNNRQLQDSEEAEEGPVPAWDAANPEKPTKPVGTEFVRPVVGYFCNLCQLIYADEDEAKLQHCSSLTHYRKYQEKTGKDPWSS